MPAYRRGRLIVNSNSEKCYTYTRRSLLRIILEFVILQYSVYVYEVVLVLDVKQSVGLFDGCCNQPKIPVWCFLVIATLLRVHTRACTDGEGRCVAGAADISVASHLCLDPYTPPAQRVSSCSPHTSDPKNNFKITKLLPVTALHTEVVK